MDGLRIDPCIPHSWQRFKANRRFRGKSIAIDVKNPQGVCKGVQSMTLNGLSLPGNLIPADQLGGTNIVEVLMG